MRARRYIYLYIYILVFPEHVNVIVAPAPQQPQPAVNSVLHINNPHTHTFGILAPKPRLSLLSSFAQLNEAAALSKNGNFTRFTIERARATASVEQASLSPCHHHSLIFGGKQNVPCEIHHASAEGKCAAKIFLFPYLFDSPFVAQ